jgi:hypothetical protein
VVFNSDDLISPVYIFLDDQGETGLDDVTQLWDGYVNATVDPPIQGSSSCRWGAVPGDYIATENQPAFIGTPRPPGSGIHAKTHIFDGDIDWVIWKPIADYSDVIFNGSSASAGQSQFGSTSLNESYDASEDLGMSGVIGLSGPDSVLYESASMSSTSESVFRSAAEETPAIRVCEGCHGFESLHNIQKDSDGNDVIDPGSELPYFGHIGHNDDCWGCHGFASASAAPGSGPVVPYISSSDISVITAGTDTVVTLSGSAFTNVISGFDLTSNVKLTADDGTSIELTPDAISEDTLIVTIPGTMAAGNYNVRAVKGPSESNPTVISIKPDVTITDENCNRKRGVLTINGSGFGTKPEGTDADINVEVNGVPVEVISWSDTRIKVSVSSCVKNATITVNALYGSASNSDSGGGKPPKPCKGKKCN